MKTKLFFIISIVLLVTFPVEAQTLSLDMGGGTSVTGRIFQMLALITVLSLAPSILVMMTSFTRIIIVLSFLRSALGLQQSPPTMVITSLALFLTAFVMAPTLEESYDKGIAPLIAEEISEEEAFKKAIAPVRVFMLKHVREKDLKIFNEMAGAKQVPKGEDISLSVLIPAFMISEIQRAFTIGFLIFLPFLIIDMMVSSVLMSMGMMMVPPIMIALPFKLIFFVLIDGWSLVVSSLVKGFTGVG